MVRAVTVGHAHRGAKRGATVIWAAWRDVVFRKRRFAIAVAATALVFALSLLLVGRVGVVRARGGPHTG